MKRIIAIAGACTLTLSMAACGSADTTQADNTTSVSTTKESSNTTDTTVGVIIKTAANAHFQDIAYGAMVAGKDLGIKVVIENPSSETDVEGQIAICEDLIAAGTDALVLAPNDSDGMGTAVDTAHDAGVPFVTIDTKITNVWGDDVLEYLPNYISGDFIDQSYHVAKTIFDALGGEGNVVVLRGVDAVSSSQERTAGFEKAIEEYEGIVEVASQSANFSQADAQVVMSDIIQAHPDVDAVLCCNDLMGIGACTALEDAGYKVGGEDGILIGGLDGNIAALESIEAGELYATSYNWSILWGYYGVQQAYELIQGNEVPELTVTASDTVITSENVEHFLPHGQEVAAWTLGAEIDEVSDYTRDLINEGIEMTK